MYKDNIYLDEFKNLFKTICMHVIMYICLFVFINISGRTADRCHYYSVMLH